jgi:hypothetical protein
MALRQNPVDHIIQLFVLRNLSNNYGINAFHFQHTKIENIIRTEATFTLNSPCKR